MTPRKVDPYVYVMEWIWRHSKAEGMTRLILLAIGRRMHWTPEGFETGLVPMKDLAGDAKVMDSTVRDHVGRLGMKDGDVEIIRSKRRGEHLRFRLRRERLLPLDDIEPSAQRRMAALSAPNPGVDSAPNGGGDNAESRRPERRLAAVPAPRLGGDLADVSISPEGVRTEDHHHDDVSREVASLYGWWLVAFPTHRGVPADVTREDFDEPARELLALGYTVADVQAMALLMWAVRDLAVHDWIPTTNYSIRVLRRTATWLAQRVREQAARVREPWVCPHVDACAHRAMCDHKNHLPQKYPRRSQEAAG